MRSIMRIAQNVHTCILFSFFTSCLFAGTYRDNENHFSFTIPASAKALYRPDLEQMYSDTMLSNLYWKDVIGMVLLEDTNYVSYPFITVRKEPLEPESRVSFVTYISGVYWGLQNNKASNPQNMVKTIDSLTAIVATDLDLDGGIRGRVITKYYLADKAIFSITCYAELAKAAAAKYVFDKTSASFVIDKSKRFISVKNDAQEKGYSNSKMMNAEGAYNEIELSNGWRRFVLNKFGTVDIPPSLEIQQGFYKSLHDALLGDSTGTSKTLILQQHGLNDLKAGAQSKYARIMIDNIELGADKLGTLTGPLSFSEADLTEFSDAIKEQVLSQKGMKIISMNKAILKAINGMNAIQIDYKRQLNDNPVVHVFVYMFPNEDYLHKITTSFRVQDAQLWKSDFSEFMQRIKIEERQPRAELKKKDPMNILFGENWQIVWVISFLITWIIGLFPPLLIRYVIRRKPLKKWSSIMISVTFWVVNIGIFTALESKSKTHTALTIIMVVSYFIMRSGSKKQKLSENI